MVDTVIQEKKKTSNTTNEFISKQKNIPELFVLTQNPFFKKNS